MDSKLQARPTSKTSKQEQQVREENTNIKHERTPQTNHEDDQRSLYEKSAREADNKLQSRV